jgi:hypothetical protein
MAATFIVETGSGVTGANSYISVADADLVFDNLGQAAEWDAVTDKEQRLRDGTRYLDLRYGLQWRGLRAAIDNPLEWPRVRALDASGYLIASTTVPQALKLATCLAAIRAVTPLTLLPDVANAPIKRIREKVDVIETETEYVVGLSPYATYTEIDLAVAGLINSGVFLDRI